MSTGKATPIELPAPLTEEECVAFRASNPISLFDQHATGIMKSYVDGTNHALLRDICSTAAHIPTIAAYVTSYYDRDTYNVILSNLLVLHKKLMDDGHTIDRYVMTSAVVVLTADKKTDSPRYIATQEEMEGCAAVLRFINAHEHEVGGPTKLKMSEWDGQQYSHLAVGSRYLDAFIRENPELTDKIITFSQERPFGRRKKDLGPLLDYLNPATPSAVMSGWL